MDLWTKTMLSFNQSRMMPTVIPNTIVWNSNRINETSQWENSSEIYWHLMVDAGAIGWKMTTEEHRQWWAWARSQRNEEETAGFPTNQTVVAPLAEKLVISGSKLCRNQCQCRHRQALGNRQPENRLWAHMVTTSKQLQPPSTPALVKLQRK